MGRMQKANDMLRAALKKRGLSYSDLARVIDVKPSTVSRWATGDAKPDPHIRVALARIIPELPETIWFSAKERREIDSAVAKWTEIESSRASEAA